MYLFKNKNVILNTTNKLYKYLSTNLTKPEWFKPTGEFDTGIKIYNCVAREKVPLILENSNYATWYTCGPTVYDAAHIGHASTYVKLDILKKILKNHFKINLVTAMNITDIDDKIIKTSQEMDLDWKTLARSYELEFWAEMEMLDVDEPDFKIRVTENIPEIIEFIEELIKSNSAYLGTDNSVYFEVEKFKTYGKLQRLNLEDEKHDIKKSKNDFALWKGNKTSDEPCFDSPWGKGRPGWHIECSAMATTIFGKKIDFHCGGLDLKFPHHENEEAQSCCYHKTNQWVNYWIHTGHLNVQGDTEKMSKSLGNTISISDLLSLYPPETFRVACVLSNYRNAMEFSAESMKNAESILRKFLSFFSDTNAYTEGIKAKTNYDATKFIAKLKETEQKIDIALRDDFDTAKVMSYLLDLSSFVLKIINNNESTKMEDFNYYLHPAIVQGASNMIINHLDSLGLSFNKKSGKDDEKIYDIEEILDGILKIRSGIRETAMKTKNDVLFKASDAIRDRLKESGIMIKDHGNLSSWEIIKVK